MPFLFNLINLPCNSHSKKRNQVPLHFLSALCPSGAAVKRRSNANKVSKSPVDRRDIKADQTVIILTSFLLLSHTPKTEAQRSNSTFKTMNSIVGCTLLLAFAFFASLHFNHASPIGVTSERNVNLMTLQANTTALATVDTLNTDLDLSSSNSTDLVRQKRQGGGGCGCGCCCRPRCCCRCCCCCVRCCCRVVCCRPCCRPCCCRPCCGCGCGGGGGMGRKRRALTDLSHKLMDKQASKVLAIAFEEPQTTTVAAPAMITVAQIDSFGRRYSLAEKKKEN